ncbi:unnamed protein product [Discula destructiva]
MARVTRSSKLRETPTPSPIKKAKAKADPDTPIASVEAPPRKNNGKGPHTRKARKKRQRDVAYKKKKRAQHIQLKSSELDNLSLGKPERDTLRAGIHGDNTSLKLLELVLDQRVEIARLCLEVHGNSESVKETAAVSPNSDRAETKKRRQTTTTA